MIALLLLLLAASLAIPALIAAVGAGMVLGLFLYDRLMAAPVYKRANRLVAEAEAGPPNIAYLTPAIEVQHREGRLLRLLEREW